MKAINLYSILIFSFLSSATAQVGINTIAPNSILDIRSSNQATPANNDGILIPRIDEFPLTSPTALQDGMMVFVTGTGTPTKGFYYWDNSLAAWQAIIGAKKINDLEDGKSDNDGSQDGSSVFLGIGAGASDDETDNRNVGVGFESLYDSNDGEGNVAVGYQSLHFNNDGSFNVAMGYQSLFANNGGSYNVSNGAYSLFYNNDGSYNVANGAYALYSNRDGDENVANGAYSMYNNIDGSYNVANGSGALRENISGEYNVANGFAALRDNQGNYNVAEGAYSLALNTTGEYNVAIGYESMYRNNDGGNNVALGPLTLTYNSSGNYNVTAGSESMYSNTTGSNNVAAGRWALFNNTTGNENIAIGHQALYSNNGGTGNRNIAIGYQAGSASGYGSICIGTNAGNGNSGSNKLYIDNDGGTPLIYGEFDNAYLEFNGNVGVQGILRTNVVNINDGVASGVALRVNGSEALWYNGTYFSYGYGGSANYFSDNVGIGIGTAATNPNAELVVVGDIEYTGTITDVSDKRLKENLEPISKALEGIQKINGYSYNMIEDDENNREYGVLAQDVQKVFTELVRVIDEEEHLGVSYIQFIPILVEAIKEQQKIIEQQRLERLEQDEELNTLVDSYTTLLNRIESLETKNPN